MREVGALVGDFNELFLTRDQLQSKGCAQCFKIYQLLRLTLKVGLL